MDVTNEWMDDTEKLLKSFSVGMDPEEASKLQEKTEVCFVFFSLSEGVSTLQVCFSPNVRTNPRGVKNGR